MIGLRIVAEAGACHNNSVERAIEMARAARVAGATHIKFQLYKAERLAAVGAPKYWHDTIGTHTQREAFGLSDHMDYSAWADVKAACDEIGIVFFATPFDLEAVEALAKMDVQLYKVASGDITHRDLIQAIAETGQRVVLSTGASTLAEIARAVEWINPHGSGDVALWLLACSLIYPCPDNRAHLTRIGTLRSACRSKDFWPRASDLAVGYSDHTLTIVTGALAVAVGARMLEKHFTLDTGLPDVPDHQMALTPARFADYVALARIADGMLGSPALEADPREIPARDGARRALYARHPIPAGTIITAEMVEALRPCYPGAVEPHESRFIVGRRALVTIPAGMAFMLRAGRLEVVE